MERQTKERDVEYPDELVQMLRCDCAVVLTRMRAGVWRNERVQVEDGGGDPVDVVYLISCVM